MESLVYLFVGMFILFTLYVIVLFAYKSYTGKLLNFEFSDISFYLGFDAAIGVCALFMLMINESTPSAMDVYRGKTVLEVTYEGDVPVDSIVKFKEVDKKLIEYER